MTRQPSSLEKVLRGISWLISVLALGSSLALYYLTTSKMGVARHMAYLASKWEGAYPLGPMKVLGLWLCGICLIFLLVYIIRDLGPKIYGIFALCMDILALAFTSKGQGHTGPAYYPMALILMANAIQASLVLFFISTLNRKSKNTCNKKFL